MYTPFFIMQNECKSSVRVQFRVQFWFPCAVSCAVFDKKLSQRCHFVPYIYRLSIIFTVKIGIKERKIPLKWGIFPFWCG